MGGFLGSDIPIDLGLRWRGNTLIGSTRTLGGVALACALGCGIGAAQGALLRSVHIALGAHFGTICNSLLKRQLQIAEGKHCIPLDQIDFILGAGIFCLGTGYVSLGQFGAGLVLGATFHTAVNLLCRKWWEQRFSKTS